MNNRRKMKVKKTNKMMIAITKILKRVWKVKKRKKRLKFQNLPTWAASITNADARRGVRLAWSSFPVECVTMSLNSTMNETRRRTIRSTGMK